MLITWPAFFFLNSGKEGAPEQATNAAMFTGGLTLYEKLGKRNQTKHVGLEHAFHIVGVDVANMLNAEDEASVIHWRSAHPLASLHNPLQ